MTPLHHIGDLLRELLLQVPLPVVRALFVATPVLLLVWILQLPRADTTDPAAPDGRNLKPWAALALAVQIVIYLLL